MNPAEFSSPLARSLAMDPAIARREAAASLAAAPAKVIPFEPVKPRLTMQQAVDLYLQTPHAPNGFAKALAAENNLCYGTLMNRISAVRQRSLFA